MYKLSYEKCVCFIFLVMVAVLSCSGFRIDSLAMTDISKRNAYTPVRTSLNSDFLSRLVQSTVSSQQDSSNAAAMETSRERYLARKYFQRPHRIRHSRMHHHQQQAQATPFEPVPTGRIDAIVIPPPSIESDPFRSFVPSEKLAQIPAPSELARPTSVLVVARPHRSHRTTPQRQRHNRKLNCQEQDVGRKAYLANTVVLAKAESMSSNRVRNYSVSFRILRRFKEPGFAVDENLRLTFLNETRRMNCESELSHRRGLVKAQIQQAKEYYLFLNAHGNHNYTVLGMPVLRRHRKRKKPDIEDIIVNVTKPNFEPKLKSVRVHRAHAKGSKVRLECSVSGKPIPVITWRKNGAHLRKSNNTRITYDKRGRNSTLVIKNAQERDLWQYSCVATSVNGMEMAQPNDIPISNSNEHGEPCGEKWKNSFCQNGGTCYRLLPIQEMFCECPDGFSGARCDKKEVSIPIQSKRVSRTLVLVHARTRTL